METPIIYNIFPALAGKTRNWLNFAKNAKKMGFNSIYINPIQKPGLSGSIYAIKDFFVLNPILQSSFESPTGLEEIENLFLEIKQLGLRIYMDLVINHTSIDCPLTLEHPDWYKKDADGELLHPSAIDPADARNITVWGDLYEIDNENSSDKENLWKFWETLVETYVRLGITGFRCDAAYKVPASLWKRLINKAEQTANEHIPFIAETLGCKIYEVEELANAGFDYIYNSSKWWNFDQPWALEQHRLFSKLAPSISFPESHDTPRLFQETHHNIQVQKQRYAFAIAFSKGIQITMGYEYGWQKQCHVVKTSPSDQEEKYIDLTEFILFCNKLKQDPLFNDEGHFELLSDFNSSTITLEKTTIDNKKLIILINKDWHNSQTIQINPKYKLLKPFTNQGWQLTNTSMIEMEPAEVIYATF